MPAQNSTFEGSPAPADSHVETVLVTGAAGFIGSHTTDRLLESGRRVIGLDDLSTGKSANLVSASTRRSFEFIRGDVTDPETIRRVFSQYQPDSVIHLAGLVSVTRAQAEPDLNFKLNVQATQILAEAARRHEVRRIVFSSSAAVYGDNSSLPLEEISATVPIGQYGAAKLASEILLKGFAVSYGITTICLRYFNAFGPRQDPKSPYSGVISIFGDRYAAGKPVKVFGDGTQTRDFVSVHDIARANVLAATKPGLESAVCNICTGRQQSLLDLIGIFEKLFPSSLTPEFEPKRDGEILHSCGSPALAERILGFRSQVDLAAGLEELTTYLNPGLISA